MSEEESSGGAELDSRRQTTAKKFRLVDCDVMWAPSENVKCGIVTGYVGKLYDVEKRNETKL
jgi:hypothetical protein